MGAHSTMLISTDDARMLLMKKLMRATDRQLEELMDAAYYDKLFNFVVDDYHLSNVYSWSYDKDAHLLEDYD